MSNYQPEDLEEELSQCLGEISENENQNYLNSFSRLSESSINKKLAMY